MTKKAIWLPLGLAVAAAVALTGLFASDAQAGQPQATVAIGSTSCAPAAACGPVDITVTPAGATVVGALDVDVVYDPAVLGTPACTPAASCNPTFAANTIRFSLANLSGLSGAVGTVSFVAVGADGTSSTLDVVINTCADDIGSNITCADTDGSINVQAATPTPAPTPVPTAAPTSPGATTPPGGATPTPVPGAATVTPAGVPSSAGDGSGGNGGMGTLPLFLAAIGIAAITAGAWAVTRLRRVRA